MAWQVMSIRALKHMDCPNCGPESLHNGMTCMTCGNVQLNGYGAWQKFQRKHAAKLRGAGCPDALVSTALNRFRTVHRKERAKIFASIAHFNRAKP